LTMIHFRNLVNRYSVAAFLERKGHARPQGDTGHGSDHQISPDKENPIFLDFGLLRRAELRPDCRRDEGADVPRHPSCQAVTSRLSGTLVDR